MFLINSSQSRFSAPFRHAETNRDRAPLLRTYGVKLPSSLRTILSSAVRILSSPTCVSFGTDPHFVTGRLFSVTQFHTSTTNWPRPCGNPQSNSGLWSWMTSRRINLHTECRNINLLSIVYAFRPRLRVRLTLGGFTFPRNP